MSPLSRYRYTQIMFLTLFALLHFSPPIFATRFIHGSPSDLDTPPYKVHRWPGELPMTLKYAFLEEKPLDYLRQTDVKSAFARSFATWSSVIPVSFEKTGNFSIADVIIGFFRGDHGDELLGPFDGMGGILAHTWSRAFDGITGNLTQTLTPPSATIHMDADERWAVDFDKEKSEHAFDLQSIVAHEVGHLLGLNHTEFEGAIMYPTMSPRIKRVDLTIDDVTRIQGLQYKD